MTWLARLLGVAPSESERIAPTDHRVLCECGSDQPMASVVKLRSFALRNGVLISEFTGERVCCQTCGNTFSIGPHGRFKQHAQALPYSRVGIPEPERHAAPGEQAPPPVRQSVLGVPIERPNV